MFFIYYLMLKNNERIGVLGLDTHNKCKTVNGVNSFLENDFLIFRRVMSFEILY